MAFPIAATTGIVKKVSPDGRLPSGGLGSAQTHMPRPVGLARPLRKMNVGQAGMPLPVRLMGATSAFLQLVAPNFCHDGCLGSISCTHLADNVLHVFLCGDFSYVQPLGYLPVRAALTQ